MKLKLKIIALFSIVLMGCTIQKKQHFSGYYVKWHNSVAKSNTQNDKQEIIKESLKKSTVNNKIEDQKISSVIVESSIEEKIKPLTDVENNSNLKELEVFSNTDALKVNKISTNVSENDSTISSFINNKKSGDSLTYWSLGLMSLATMFGLRLGKKRLNKISKWAANNPRKTQWLIAGLQLPTMAGATYAGYNLDKLGYEMSSGSNIVFGNLALLSFISTPFLRKKGEITLKKKLSRRRLAFTTATLSSLMLLANLGNNISKTHPDSFVANSLEHVDQSIFGKENTVKDDAKSLDFNKAKSYTLKKIRRARSGGSAGMCFLAVLLTILLVVTLCAGVCIAVLGASGGAVIGGIAIAVLSIYGIVEIFRSGWCKKRDERRKR